MSARLVVRRCCVVNRLILERCYDANWNDAAMMLRCVLRRPVDTDRLDFVRGPFNVVLLGSALNTDKNNIDACMSQSLAGMVLL